MYGGPDDWTDLWTQMSRNLGRRAPPGAQAPWMVIGGEWRPFTDYEGPRNSPQAASSGRSGSLPARVLPGRQGWEDGPARNLPPVSEMDKARILGGRCDAG
jgi:hypothetical protein